MPAGAAYASSSCFETPDTGFVCTPDTEVFTGIDPTPSTDTSAIDVPPASVVTSKEEEATDFSTQGASLMATNALAPIPADSGEGGGFAIETHCIDPGDCGSGSAPGNYGLSVTGHMQQKKSWCVPATSETILVSMGATDPGQAALATAMHTTSTGTNLAYVSKPLNNRQSRNYYQWKTDTDSPGQLLGRAMTDIWRLKSTYLIAIDISSIGYYPAGWTGSHVVDNYAYYSQSGGGLYVFDPMNPAYTDGRSYYGKHNVKLATIYASMQNDGWGIVW